MLTDTVEVQKDYLERLEHGFKKRGLKIEELKAQIDELCDQKSAAEFIIESELRPRIQRENRTYDAYVTGCTGEFESERFCDRVDELENMVKNPDLAKFYEWESAGPHEICCDDDFYAMILYLLKNREDVEKGVYYIEEKD